MFSLRYKCDAQSAMGHIKTTESGDGQGMLAGLAGLWGEYLRRARCQLGKQYVWGHGTDALKKWWVIDLNWREGTMQGSAEGAGDPFIHWWHWSRVAALALGHCNPYKLIRSQKRNSSKALLGLVLQWEGVRTPIRCPWSEAEGRWGGREDLIP